MVKFIYVREMLTLSILIYIHIKYTEFFPDYTQYEAKPEILWEFLLYLGLKGTT